MADVTVAEGEPLQFGELPLSPSVLRGLAEAGFTRPSPIQARAIPLGQFGVDLIAQAKSGTGKTLVFVTIALELVKPNQPAPQALLVAPTREIALQSRDVCRALGSHVSGLSCHAFVGGSPMKTDVALASSCLIACGTPGRLVGLLLSEALIAEHVRLLVLDEADKLCDEGFESQLRYLLTALPHRKQMLAFSATYPPELLQALKSSMRSPLTLSLLPCAGEGDTSRSGGGGSGGGGQPGGRAASRGAASCSTIAMSGMDDPDDPLALLERPETLGAQSGLSSSVGALAAAAAGLANRTAARGARSGRTTCGDGSGSSGLASGDGSGYALGEGELVGSAALQNVRQCYQVIYPNGDGSKGGGGKGGGGKGGGKGGNGGGGEGSAAPSPKQQEILDLLDTLTFHQVPSSSPHRPHLSSPSLTSPRLSSHLSSHLSSPSFPLVPHTCVASSTSARQSCFATSPITPSS